jgi:hypothetical protein
MQVTLPPSEREMNAQAIKRAIDRKKLEVDQARQKLVELQAELRGLNIALETIEPKNPNPINEFGQPYTVGSK